MPRACASKIAVSIVTRIDPAIQGASQSIENSARLTYGAVMLHFPSPDQYTAERPLGVLLETITPTDNCAVEVVELPASEIADLQSVQRQVRLKWDSLPLDERLSGVAVRAVTYEGESLYAYILADFACELYRVSHAPSMMQMDAAKIFLRMIERGSH
jgi:hypothetical protein